MNAAERLAMYLEGEMRGAVLSYADRITDLRVRCGRSTTLKMMDGGRIDLAPMCREAFDHLLLRLMDNSVYARSEEIKNGYFSASGGIRIGISGRIEGEHTDISCITSICIRFVREMIGCADRLRELVLQKRFAGLLILSPPGMGKTTMLRDLARGLSSEGAEVAVVDERRELCGCIDGVPAMDVGAQTDIMDGCAKHIAIPMLVRGMAPEIIIADEIGGDADAESILDACRCGVTMIASAHGSDIDSAARRSCIGTLLHQGAFDYAALLGKRPGTVLTVRDLNKGVDLIC